MSIIEVQNLKKYFGKTKAVDGVSVSIEKGEIFGFLGPNGAGKTTTIRCMMDFIRPTLGKLTILGMDAQKDSVALKGKIGHLSSESRLYDNWTGEEHIEFIRGIRGDKDAAKELTKRLSLNPKIKSRHLSSGNKQKLALILALMAEPEVLILDEPTLGLDPLLQNEIYQILRELQKKGCTIFMSSHNLHEVEEICDRVAIIKEGKLVATENIKELKQKRMYTVIIDFEQKIKPDEFKLPNVKIAQELSQNRLILNAKGDINPLIQKLAQYKLKDLQILGASLEEIFLEFYR